MKSQICNFKSQILLIAALAASLPLQSYARGPQLKSLDIHTVYIYSSMVHQDDATAQREIAWLHQAMPDVLGWQVVDKAAAADAVVIAMPHGVGYQSGVSSSCSSLAGFMDCSYGDGSSIRVDCTDWDCESSYNAGNYISLIVATHVGDPALGKLRAVWSSDHGFGAGGDRDLLSLMHDNARSQNAAAEDSVIRMCHTAGIAGGRKCWHMIDASWKSFFSSASQDPSVFTLPN